MMTEDQALKIAEDMRLHPEHFFSDFLGVTPWEKQLEIAHSVRDNVVTSVKSCHAIGKSWIAARVAVWFLISHPDSIVVTTAPTWRQVKDILWREIGTAVEKAKVPLAPTAPNVSGWEIAKNWFAVGLSTTDPDKFQGYHSDSGYILVIVDEAAGVPEPIFEGVDAILTSPMAKLLMIGNPTSSAGSFKLSHKKDSAANCITISAFDTPNFTANGIANIEDLVNAIENDAELEIVAPHLIAPSWVYHTGYKKWGVESPMFAARIMGEFPDMAEDTLIPLNWIELAMEHERHERIKPNGQIRYGVDVARFGSDNTVIVKRDGDIVGMPAVYSKEDTMRTADRVDLLLENSPMAKAFIDVIGVGGGVVDRLAQMRTDRQRETGEVPWVRFFAINVAEKADEKQSARLEMKFGNKRAEIYWRLREKFEKGEIALDPEAEDLAYELSIIRYKYDKNGTIWIEEKSEMKKRLLRSPDQADALMLSYGEPPTGEFQLRAQTDVEREQESGLEPATTGLIDQVF